MLKRKTLDLGNSDFKSVIENHYFVDKSLFIEEVITAEKQVLLIPRPRRFGKTLNLSMLKYFFDITEPENDSLFKALKIWKADKEIIRKQGKFPVIHLSFKDAKQDNWEDTLKHIKIEISNLFGRHRYLLQGDTLFENEKNKFNHIINEAAGNVDFEVSLKLLSSYLFRYHKQKAVILIDEYDTPIQASHNIFYDKAISFMRNLMSGAFKDNTYLYKGVITGILRISKESIFTGLNNVNVHSVLDYRFSDKFGFTEKETKKILSDFGLSEEYSGIKRWYNGYSIGDTGGIYNPWSILKFVLEYKQGFRTFWANTSSDDLIKERLNEQHADYIREQFQILINNETIEKEIEENFVFPDLDKKGELLWTLLTYSGYLTVKNKTGRKKYELAIPNYEIKTIFQDLILNWLESDIKIRKSLLEKTIEYLINNKIKKFENGFKEIMGDTFSYFDTGKNPEYAYQSYVLGLLAIIGDDYIIKSNKESGKGRYDIMLIPHDKTKFGIVIEIKAIGKEASPQMINKEISKAQKQIENNKYFKELTENKISKIITLPIVFTGKEPHILHIDE